MSAAHPLPAAPAVLLRRSLQETADGLDACDARAYVSLLAPFVDAGPELLSDLLAPLGLPRRPLTMLRFGLHALRSASGLARGRFRGPRAQALLAGCAAHATMPLEHRLTAALGLVFLLTGHLTDWPVVKGGSAALTRALLGVLSSLGGRVETGRPVRSLHELPPSRVVLFDTSPANLLAVAGDALPRRYAQRLRRFRYGPGVFKVDWALDGPIPWADPSMRRAATVHLGGTLEEVSASEAAMWRGHPSDRPFVLLCQQSVVDPSRAPAGKHTGYAYCHVPSGSTVDHTAAIEAQVERFAPGFQSLILARHTMTAAAFDAYNPAWPGGAISGGVSDLTQLFTRPVARWSPYSTPNPRLFLCSASTPPGGGVHGMCGHHAARAALRTLSRR